MAWATSRRSARVTTPCAYGSIRIRSPLTTSRPVMWLRRCEHKTCKCQQAFWQSPRWQIRVPSKSTSRRSVALSILQFADIIIKSDNEGRVTRVRDVGRVELGAVDYGANGYKDHERSVPILIYRRPGSNELATGRAIRTTMAELSKDFPPGVAYMNQYDATVFISQSVHEVVMAIIGALLLVVLVVILFLQTWRASIIPIVAIPVSLVGTFAVLAGLGFSLNSLSLFGLVLAVGIVVDDAIVVVENVERNLSLGLSPREAAHKTMDEVGGALIAIALTLCAVFIPSAFIPGISGE